MLVKTTVTRREARCLPAAAVLILSVVMLADTAVARSLPVAADGPLSGRSVHKAAPYEVDGRAGRVAHLLIPPGARSLVTLPAGRSGRSYHRRLTGEGGTPPHRFALESGSLPPGLALSDEGVLSGTPTGAGDWSFTARVVDSGGQSATQSYQLRIMGSEPLRR
jgi:hypothetical protein